MAGKVMDLTLEGFTTVDFYHLKIPFKCGVWLMSFIYVESYWLKIEQLWVLQLDIILLKLYPYISHINI